MSSSENPHFAPSSHPATWSITAEAGSALYVHHLGEEGRWAITSRVQSAQEGKQDTQVNQPLCLQQKSPSPQTTQMIISTLHFTVAVKTGFCLECSSPLVLATRLFLCPGVNRPTLRLNFWIWEQCRGRGTWLSVVLPTGLPSRSPRLMPTTEDVRTAFTFHMLWQSTYVTCFPS